MRVATTMPPKWVLLHSRKMKRLRQRQISAQTVEVPSIYSRSTYTLLGQLSDPLFGDLRSSYITRLRHAPGFKFAHEPEGKKIDSVLVEISYSSWAGDRTLWAGVT